MKKSIKVILLTAVIFLFVGQVCSADVITLRSGQQISGEIISAIGSHVTIRDEYGIEYSVAKTDIARIEFGVLAVAPQQELAPEPEPVDQPEVNQEIEPNNDFASGNPIELNSVVSGEISPRGDRDYFYVSVTEAGVLSVEMRCTHPAARPMVRLINGENVTILNWVVASDAGRSATLTYDVGFQPTEQLIYLEVAHSGDNLETAYELTVDFRPIRDPFEPNNSFGAAKRITLGTEYQAYIFPIRDVDWYLVQIPARGTFRLKLTSPDPAMRLSARLVNPLNHGLTNWVAAEDFGQDVEIEFDVAEPTAVFVEVHQHQHQRRSTEPYTILASFHPVEDQFEPNDTFGHRTLIPVGETVSAYIFPARDRDYFELQFDQPGLLTVEATLDDPTMRLQMRLVNAENHTARNWVTAPEPGEPVVLEHQIATDMIVIELAQHADSRRSHVPYSLETSFVAVVDAYEPNNSFSTAKAISIGEEVEAFIFPSGDRDWFKLQIAEPSHLEIEVTGPEPLRMSVRVVNANAHGHSNWVTATEAGATASLRTELRNPGTYYLEVAANDNRTTSTEPYTLTSRVAPLAEQ